MSAVTLREAIAYAEAKGWLPHHGGLMVEGAVCPLGAWAVALAGTDELRLALVVPKLSPGQDGHDGDPWRGSWAEVLYDFFTGWIGFDVTNRLWHTSDSILREAEEDHTPTWAGVLAGLPADWLDLSIEAP